MTPEQASASLAKAIRKARRLNSQAIRALAADAIPLIEVEWPVATGRSQEGWTDVSTTAGAAIANPVPYASEVHSGLADTLVPSVISSLEEDWRATVNRTLLPILEGR